MPVRASVTDRVSAVTAYSCPTICCISACIKKFEKTIKETQVGLV
jgi:hypothetical protein